MLGGLVFCFGGTGGSSVMVRVRGGCFDCNARGLRGSFWFISPDPPAFLAVARDSFATAADIAVIAAYSAVIAADSVATAIDSSVIANYRVAIGIYISVINADGFAIATCSVVTGIYTLATNTDGVAMDADGVAMKAVPIETIANMRVVAGYNT